MGETSKIVDRGSRLSHGPAVLDFAAEVGESGPVAVIGGQTAWSVGGAPVPGASLIRAPAGVVDYKPEEMTVRVGAGTTVAELNEVLAASGQRTGLPDRGGTVGGAVAVGYNDRDVLGRGTTRSSVLQVSYISAEGKIISGGGPTVKNVSGFDLPRLMVGSLGTLGCLAEFILRTNPIPASSQWFASSADPFALYDALLAPSAVLWDGSTSWVHLEGYAPDVAHEVAAASKVGPMEEVGGPPEPPGERRWSLAPGDLRTVPSVAAPFLASIGVGLVLSGEPAPARALDPAVTEIHDRMKLLFDPTGRLNPGRHPAK